MACGEAAQHPRFRTRGIWPGWHGTGFLFPSERETEIISGPHRQPQNWRWIAVLGMANFEAPDDVRGDHLRFGKRDRLADTSLGPATEWQVGGGSLRPNRGFGESVR